MMEPGPVTEVTGFTTVPLQGTGKDTCLRWYDVRGFPKQNGLIQEGKKLKIKKLGSDVNKKAAIKPDCG
jgi:hypothetical protein